jgi:hypothetical protein
MKECGDPVAACRRFFSGKADAWFNPVGGWQRSSASFKLNRAGIDPINNR